MVKVTTLKQVQKEIRGQTMACWWPSRITGKAAPDWVGILGELEALLEGAKARMAYYGTATPAEVLRLQELRQWTQSQVDDCRRVIR